MNAAIANILKGYLTPLSWVEHAAGLVKPLIKLTSVPKDGKMIVTRDVFPVSCDVSWADCQGGKYKDLIPAQKYRSIIYFEDLGCVKVSNDGGYHNWKSRLKLVGWVNMSKFNFNGCYLSPLLIQSIEKALPDYYFNSPPYAKIQVLSVSELPKDATIFSKYTYKEEVMQYLMFPFDYFALQIDTEFSISPDCIDEITLKDDACAD